MMKLKKLLLPSLTMIGLSAVTSVNAATIASQNFDTAQNLVAGAQSDYTDGIGDIRTAYLGSGLGFVSAGNTSGSSNGPLDTNTTATGKFYTGDVSGTGETFARASNGGADGKYTPPGTINFDRRSGTYTLFNTVDMSGYNSSTLTFDLDSARTDADDSMFVRLFLDGSATGIDLLTIDYDDTETTGFGTTFTSGTLTYNFDDAVTSAQLFIGFRIDDNNDFFTLDNVSFDGTAVPEPTTTALLGLGGLALILRRRK
jgi:hypothetical protein